MNEKDEPLFLKALVVGDSGVGKTSILSMYCHKRFSRHTQPTVGCDFTTKVITYGKEKKSIRLQMWDVAGQEKFRALSKLYVRGAVGCFIVCDIEKNESLQDTLYWKKLIEENSDYKSIPIILLQNKIDLKMNGSTSITNLSEKNNENDSDFTDLDELKNFSKENNYDECFQVSAKENINLNEAFKCLVDHIFKKGIVEDFYQNKNSNAASLCESDHFKKKPNNVCC